MRRKKVKYTYVLIFSDGERQQSDEIFETESDAEQAAQEDCDGYRTGCEVLALSSGDYDYVSDDDDRCDYEIIEVEED